MEAFVIASTLLAVAFIVLWAVRRWPTGQRVGVAATERTGTERGVDAVAADTAPIVIAISVPSSRRAPLVTALNDRGLRLEPPDADGPAVFAPEVGSTSAMRRRKVRIHTADGPGTLDTVLAVLGAMGFQVDHADARDIVLRGWEVGEARVAVREHAEVGSAG
jgi:hypothetical protein